MNRRLKPILVCCLIFLTFFAAAGFQAYTQEKKPDEGRKKIDASLLTFTLSPGVEFPVEMADKNLITFGFSTDLTGSLPLPFLPFLSPAVNLSYSYIPVRADTSMSVIGIDGGFRIGIEPVPRLLIYSLLGCGGYISLFNENLQTPDGTPYDNQAGGSFHAFGGLGVSFFLTPFLSVGISGAYKYHHDMYHGIRASVGSSIHIDGFSRKVAIDGIELQPVFPVLYKYYDSNPIGRARISNNERFQIKDLEISVYSDKYMDKPKISSAPELLKPGEAAEVDLNALFGDEVLLLTEGTRVPVEITVSYTMNGVERETSSIESLRLYNRNAHTWDDDRKAAVFISAKDPELLKLSKMVAGMVRRESTAALNLNMQIGIAVYEALKVYGLNYVVDPNTPAYTEASENVSVIDFVQFPSETLTFHGGDCDDLSILYCSLLESVGIQTAFITVPGHIFAAFSLDLDRTEAERTFGGAEQLIYYDDTAWVPVEMTKVKAGFIEAWSSGCEQWKRNYEEGTAEILPVRKSWILYEAAGTPRDLDPLDLPEAEKIRTAYLSEIERFAERELRPQIEILKEKIRQSRAPYKLKNRLGILYARYGMYDEAENLFREILQNREYAPAVVNLATLYYKRGDLEEAEKLFKDAEELSPDNRSVLLNLARISYIRKRYVDVNRYYGRLEKYYPDIAERYSYLSPSEQLLKKDEARALDIDRLNEQVLWEVEE